MEKERDNDIERQLDRKADRYNKPNFNTNIKMQNGNFVVGLLSLDE